MPKRYRVDRFPFVGSNSGYLSQPDPDLEIREGGGSGHSDPYIRGRASLQKKHFWRFGPQFGLDPPLLMVF